MTSREPTWGEKTVEWKFAQSLVTEHTLTASPLSGNAESAAGDALAQFDGNLALVEFKRTAAVCHDFSELSKYARDVKCPSSEMAKAKFEDAKNTLLNAAAFPSQPPHLFVYGKWATAPSKEPGFSLEASKYWCNTPISCLALDAVKEVAVCRNLFDLYALKLAELRSYETSGGGGGGCIVGFSGDTVTVMSFNEYTRSKTLSVTPPDEPRSPPDEPGSPSPNRFRKP